MNPTNQRDLAAERLAAERPTLTYLASPTVRAVVCPECGRRFDPADPTDAAELAYGHDCEAVPTCDICGHHEDEGQDPSTENNWNGETGNHLSCESAARWLASRS